MKLIIDMPKGLYERIKWVCSYGMGDDLQKKVIKGIPIPENATNGDVIKAIFPNGTTEKFVTFMRFIDGEYCFNFSADWWNAPFQKGGKEWKKIMNYPKDEE